MCITSIVPDCDLLNDSFSLIFPHTFWEFGIGSNNALAPSRDVTMYFKVLRTSYMLKQPEQALLVKVRLKILTYMYNSE